MRKVMMVLLATGFIFLTSNVRAECSCDATNAFKCKVKCCNGGSVSGYGKGTACFSFEEVN